MPILYDYLRAPSPRRARILLAEKGIAHDTVIVDLAAGEQLGEVGLLGIEVRHGRIV